MENTRLYEKYRPKSIDEVLGQDKAIREIEQILSRGWGGQAWWISGESGIGKTTIARIIANQGPEQPRVIEFDGPAQVTLSLVHEIQPIGSFPFWTQAIIINEAHGLKIDVIREFLGLLERLSRSTIIIFTTTKKGQADLVEAKMDAGPLLSRCHTIGLTNQGLSDVFAQRCQEIAIKEKLDGGNPLNSYKKLAGKCNNNFRTMLLKIESGAMLRQ